MIKQCKWCGRDFEPSHGNQRYCSSECFAQVNKERCRKYYKSHREESLEKSREYKKANKEKIQEYQRKYYRKYYQEHREQICEHNRKYQLKRRGGRNLPKRLDDCCAKHGGIDHCPFEDCICE